MSNQIKYYSLNSLDGITAEKGSIYFLSNGSQFIGTSSNTFLPISDFIFTNNLEDVGILDKIYVHKEVDKTSLKIWTGVGYEFLSADEYDDSAIEEAITLLQNELSTLQGKVTTVESKITTNEGKISTLESKVNELENKEVEVNLSPIQTQINTLQENVNTNTADILVVDNKIETHEYKSVLDENGAHNFKVDGDRLLVFENGEWRDIEITSSILPQVSNFIGTSSSDAKSITVNWTNPTNNEFVKTELYVSNQDISSLNINELNGVAELVVDDKITTTYKKTGTFHNESWYFKAYAHHVFMENEKVSNPITVSVKANDNAPPSIVRDVVVESRDKALYITWKNPTETDLANVRLHYSTDGDINSIEEGNVAYNGTRENVLIEGLENYSNVFLRFFTIDVNGNVNSDVNMKYLGMPELKVDAIYGVKIDTTNSNPETALTYTDDAIGFTPAKMNFETDIFEYGSWRDKFPFNQIKPCVLKNGTVNYYLNPNDYTKKIDGSPADITSGNDGDVMVEFPKIYWKFERIGTDLYVRYANYEVDKSYKCLAHMRGNEEKEKAYISTYLSHFLNNKLRSLSNKTIHETIIAEHRSLATANNNYNQMTYYQLLMLQVLFIVMFKDRDSQIALGKGYTVSTNTSSTTTGNTNTKGLYYGENTGEHQMKFCGIEDFYGNGQYFIDGLFVDANFNILIGTENFNNTGNGYINHGVVSTTNLTGYVSDVQGGTETGFIIKAKEGSETTHYADSGAIYPSFAPVAGGGFNNGASAGAFYMRISANLELGKGTSRLTF